MLRAISLIRVVLDVTLRAAGQTRRVTAMSSDTCPPDLVAPDDVISRLPRALAVADYPSILLNIAVSHICPLHDVIRLDRRARSRERHAACSAGIASGEICITDMKGTANPDRSTCQSIWNQELFSDACISPLIPDSGLDYKCATPCACDLEVQAEFGDLVVILSDRLVDHSDAGRRARRWKARGV